MTLSADQLRALAVLAGAGSSGYTEHLLIAHGFSLELLAGLARAGLATVTVEYMRVDGKLIVITRVTITDAGRQAVSN